MDKVLCDTDIVSALAKAEALHLLKTVFPGGKFLITEYVQDELKKSKEEGFSFPDKIFEFCKITTLNESELKNYKSKSSLEISKTDLKNLIIAKSRGTVLLTNDSKLYREARKSGVEVYDLRQILKAIHEEELVSENELKEVVEKIEKRDNTYVKNKREIFKR